MNDCSKCSNEYICWFLISILISALLFAISVPVYIDFKEREGATNVCVQIHKEGYEVLGNFQTVDNFGRLKFHSVVKYKDGCIQEIQVPAEEYFEEVSNE